MKYASKTLRVLDLLEWCEAERYFCSKGSFAYMLEDGIFPVDGIDVLFQDFHPKFYEQVGAVKDFVPSVSIIDALMNVGPEATLELVCGGTEKWLRWEEMVISFDSNSKEGV